MSSAAKSSLWVRVVGISKENLSGGICLGFLASNPTSEECFGYAFHNLSKYAEKVNCGSIFFFPENLHCFFCELFCLFVCRRCRQMPQCWTFWNVSSTSPRTCGRFRNFWSVVKNFSGKFPVLLNTELCQDGPTFLICIHHLVFCAHAMAVLVFSRAQPGRPCGVMYVSSLSFSSCRTPPCGLDPPPSRLAPTQAGHPMT